MKDILYIALHGLKDVAEYIDNESKSDRYFYLRGQKEAYITTLSMMTHLFDETDTLSVDRYTRYDHMRELYRKAQDEEMAKFKQRGGTEPKSTYHITMMYGAMMEACDLMMSSMRQEQPLQKVLDEWAKTKMRDRLMDLHECTIRCLAEWGLSQDMQDYAEWEDKNYDSEGDYVEQNYEDYFSEMKSDVLEGS